VDFLRVSADLPRRFSKALGIAEAQRSERPIQLFLERFPAALLCLVRPHTAWVFPRLALQNALGGGSEPDFLICDWTSLGPEWTVVELESPTMQPVNARGISAACRHAQQQISDYRRTMAENTERNEKDGLMLGHRQAKSWIIIGRRLQIGRSNQSRLADLRQDDIEVATYDRLLEECEAMATYRVRQRKEAAKLRRRVKRTHRSALPR
jgi:hypothetical protein